MKIQRRVSASEDEREAEQIRAVSSEQMVESCNRLREEERDEERKQDEGEADGGGFLLRSAATS